MKRNKQRLLLTAPVILLLTIACFYTIPIGIADLHAYSPRQHLEHWQSQGSMPSQAEVTAQLGNIEQALDWQPDNAEFHDIKGLLNYYLAIHSYHDGDQHGYDSHLQASLQSYRNATQLRPNWPYSWANLALMKAAAATFDDEYRTAIHKATNLGPWENGVNINISEAGLIGWAFLDSATKAIVTDNLERTIKRNTKQLKLRLTAINKLGLACILLKSSKERKWLCRF